MKLGLIRSLKLVPLASGNVILHLQPPSGLAGIAIGEGFPSVIRTA
jgi:hypothetical protein